MLLRRPSTICLTVMKRVLACLVSLLAASPLAAHPHIFVDTGLELRFDAEGRLSEVKVTWVYDELYSLLITEEYELDPEFDGVLTPAEIAVLQGFDMNWTEGFNGDLVVLDGTRDIALSGPMAATADFADGRIITTHVRQIMEEVSPGAALDVKPYDKTYYTAYDITLPVTIAGSEACQSSIAVPDLDARLRELSAVLMSLDANVMPGDEALPDVGGLLASTVHVTCDMS